MRLAILATSAYAQTDKLTELAEVRWHIDGLAQRLTEPDAGYAVYVLPAERGLAEQVEQLMADASQSGPIEALLFYFAGYAVVSDERGPALLLDGERLSTLSLRRLRRLVSQNAPSSFIVLDTVSAFQERHPIEVVQLLNAVLLGGHAGVHVLAANRPLSNGSHDTSSWPFTSLIAMVLDWQASNTGLSPGALFAAMRGEEAWFSQIDAVELYEDTSPFTLLTAVAPVAASLPPAAAPIDTSGDAEARGDAWIAQGNFTMGLAEYGAALEKLGPERTQRHAPLYVKAAAALLASERTADALAYYEAALEIQGDLTEALEGAAKLRLAAGDQDGALELLERWLRVDPNAVVATELAARLLSEAKRWDELVGLYELVMANVSEPAAAVELALEFAALCREKLDAPPRARAALLRASELAPDDARVHKLLARLEDRLDNFEGAMVHLRRMLRSQPGDAATFRTLLRSFERSARADGAWNAACALEVLGDADINESLLAQTHRPEGLLAARGCVSEAHWRERLFCPERERFVDDLFAAIADAIIEVGIETGRRKRRLEQLDPSTAYDPQASTATLAKTLLWSARLLGMQLPKLYVVSDLKTAFATAPVKEPTLLVSKALGRGLELPELAFLWSRQLAFLRPEHRPIVLFPNVAELASLILAALSLGGTSNVAFKKLEGDAKLFARSLKRHLSPEARQRLEQVVQGFPRRDASARMLAWARAVELAASRAGLLAVGDLELAVKTTRRFPLGGLVETEDHVQHLLSYSVSEEYETLRSALGVAVKS
jgi:tetratricopeptide (TPR) repeat protein